MGTSGDYAPFSFRSSRAEAALDGLDVAVARAYAADRGLELQLVRFRWPSLVADLEAGRFDVAMSGVTVEAERSLAGRFTVPVAQSGAVVLVLDRARWPDLDRLDVNAVRIGVNRGGHLERAARRRFPRATLVAIDDNDTVLRALVEGHLDAAVSDTLEAPVWRRRHPDLGQLGPFSRDFKAYLVRTDREDLASDLDAWLLAHEADGSLAALRGRYLGEGDWPATAAPLPALAAAVRERLSLMPWVARAKSREGLPLEAPQREERVVAAAVASTHEAADALGTPAPDDARVAAFLRAQIEAAKVLERRELDRRGFEQAPPPDLDAVLRPAILRVGERMGGLVARLAAQPAPPHDAVADAVDAALDGFTLQPRQAGAIATALEGLAGSTHSAAGEKTGDGAGQDR